MDAPPKGIFYLEADCVLDAPPRCIFYVVVMAISAICTKFTWKQIVYSLPSIPRSGVHLNTAATRLPGERGGVVSLALGGVAAVIYNADMYHNQLENWVHGPNVPAVGSEAAVHAGVP